MPIKDVWRFSVLFSDGYDLWPVTDSDGVRRLAQLKDIPPDRRDARLIAVNVNYFNDTLSRPDADIRRAFFERLRGLYGDLDAPDATGGGMWLWPTEDRYAIWDNTLAVLRMGMDAFADRAVQSAIKATEAQWQHERTTQALEELDDALRGTLGSTREEPAAPPKDLGAGTTEEIRGSWRVRGFRDDDGSVSGRFEGSLILEQSERPGEVRGELVPLEEKSKGPARRISVRGSMHIASGILSRGIRTGEVHGKPLRVLILRVNDSDPKIDRPPLIYAAVLEKENELRWGTWSVRNETFLWEATRIQDGKDNVKSTAARVKE